MCVLHYSVCDLQHTWDSAGFSSCLLGGATCAEEEGAFSLLELGVGGVGAELTLLDSEILSVPEKQGSRVLKNGHEVSLHKYILIYK